MTRCPCGLALDVDASDIRVQPGGGRVPIGPIGAGRRGPQTAGVADKDGALVAANAIAQIVGIGHGQVDVAVQRVDPQRVDVLLLQAHVGTLEVERPRAGGRTARRAEGEGQQIAVPGLQITRRRLDRHLARRADDQLAAGADG